MREESRCIRKPKFEGIWKWNKKESGLGRYSTYHQNIHMVKNKNKKLSARDAPFQNIQHLILNITTCRVT